MPKQITGLPTASAANATPDDIILIRDVATGTDKQVTRANFLNEAIDDAELVNNSIKPIKLSMPRVQAYQTGTLQSIPHNVNTPIAYNAEQFDTDSFHNTSTNNSRFVAPANGLYSIQASVNYRGDGTGAHYAWISIGGNYAIRHGLVNNITTSAVEVALSVAADIYLTAGEYVEIVAFQVTGLSVQLWNNNTNVGRGRVTIRQVSW